MFRWKWDNKSSHIVDKVMRVKGRKKKQENTACCDWCRIRSGKYILNLLIRADRIRRVHLIQMIDLSEPMQRIIYLQGK